MSIIGTPKTTGVSRAIVECDECKRSETVPADYTRKTSDKWDVNTGQVLKKITQQGWSDIKGKIYCPACTAKRKAFKMRKPKASNVAEIRKPDGKQKRLIIMALEDAYDDVKKCYKGQETDKTVAENLGGGVMPGWVTSIREDMFGPAGNEEVMEVLGKITVLAAKVDEIYNASKAELNALRKRVDSVVEAHNKRVG